MAGEDFVRFEQLFDEWAKNIEQELAEALLVTATRIMRQSVREIPVDTGYARSTAFVGESPKTKSKGITSIDFGYWMKNPPGDEPYIVPLHERVDIAHPNGKALFLRDPVLAHKRSWEIELDKAILRALDKARRKVGI